MQTSKKVNQAPTLNWKRYMSIVCCTEPAKSMLYEGTFYSKHLNFHERVVVVDFGKLKKSKNGV